MLHGEERQQRKQKAFCILKNTAITIGLLATSTGLCLLLGQVDDVEHGDAYVSMLFILSIFLIARVTTGYLYGIAASLVGVLAVNFLFTYPYFAFNFSLPGYPITIACMLTVSLLTSALTTRIKRAEKLRGEAEREKLRGNLLRAISHDLRTPLTSILGANSVLMEEGDKLSPQERCKLHSEIADEAQWLIRMVENLLTITRIRQDRKDEIQKTDEFAEEVIAEAVDKFHKRFPARQICVNVPEEPVICPMDAMLIEQVLINLLENAAVHAKGATKLELTAAIEGANVEFAVADNGCGVTKERLRTLFEGGPAAEKTGDQKRDMGIGLSVCNTIICAHGGSMHAENRSGGGLRVSFRLPLEEEHEQT